MRQIINLYSSGEIKNECRRKLKYIDLQKLTYFRCMHFDTGVLLKNFFKKIVSIATTLHLRRRRINFNLNRIVSICI